MLKFCIFLASLSIAECHDLKEDEVARNFLVNFINENAPGRESPIQYDDKSLQEKVNSYVNCLNGDGDTEECSIADGITPLYGLYKQEDNKQLIDIVKDATLNWSKDGSGAAHFTSLLSDIEKATHVACAHKDADMEYMDDEGKPDTSKYGDFTCLFSTQ